LSIKYATPLHLEFKSSKLFSFYVCTVFLITLFCIYLLPLNPGLKSGLLIISSVACVYAYKSHNNIKSVIWQDNNYWCLHYAKEMLTAELTDSSFANSWLVILHFKTDTGSRCSRLICYDSLDKDVFRQLKVRLKVERLTQSSRAKMRL